MGNFDHMVNFLRGDVVDEERARAEEAPKVIGTARGVMEILQRIRDNSGCASE